ncbi:hypothetical protein [Marinovum algicola]|uniref:hypothetical protein n=1 Tax=Marinovum algicola TaxID=42444 RepID=UPI0024B9C786|nr:hypothetical protein [Marinovum algicola]
MDMAPADLASGASRVFRRYPHVFTIRTEAACGGETELSKIVTGKGERVIYGHALSRSTCFDSWWILDLRAFRAALIRQATNSQPIRCGDKRNAEGTAFKCSDIRSFPASPPLVVASSGFW